MKNRRQFIKMIVGFISGIGLLFGPVYSGIRAVFAKAKRVILPKGTRMDILINKNPADLDTRNLDLTPVEAFETMGLHNHQVNLKNWKLEIIGQVRRSLRLTYRELLEMPSIEKNVLLICPGVFAYHARWKGISVGRLLEKAQMISGVTHVFFSGPHGPYEKTESFPIEDILSDKVFLAYRVNDIVLPKKHGFPLRLVAEDYYGGHWVKYVYKVAANIS
jgi:DMSO/TMAO reductase YedYZ molybdopterin-dependent catalytic subunit